MPRTIGWLGKFAFADGTTIRVSATGSDVVFDDGGGNATFTADKSFLPGPLRFRGDGSVPDGVITVPVAISASYDAEDVFVGKFDKMEITLYAIDHQNPSYGGMQIGPYQYSEADYDDRGRVVSIEVRGILQQAKEIEVEELAVTCRSALGDTRPGFCNLPLYPNDVARNTAYSVGDYVRVSDSGDYHNRMFRCTTAGTTGATDPSPFYDYTVSNTTTDGTAVFTAEESWVRSATVATVTDDGDFTITITESRAVDGWFNQGAIKWLTGNNAGGYSQVRKWTQSGTRIQLWSDARQVVQVGDTLEILPGCDRLFATCKDKFANTINFRAEKDIPGQDFLNGAGLV